MNEWLWPGCIAAVAAAVVSIAYARLKPVVGRFWAGSDAYQVMSHELDGPMLGLLPLLAAQLVLAGVPDSLPWVDGIRHLMSVLLILALTFVAIGAVHAVAEIVTARHAQALDASPHARRIVTHTRVFASIGVGVAIFACICFVLMTFPSARQFGASLLASAGLSALVIGLAAKSVISNLLAGLQIALSQPIRIDDVLIVQGEWGRVEEITSTYVILKTWDERRVVIPLQWFIENTFQNWTRSTTQIIGTVILWVDYMTDLGPLRSEAERLARSSSDYDGRVCLLQVVDASEHAMKVRLIASSATAGQSWNLCCMLREGLIAFMRRDQPHALPRARAEWVAMAGDSPGKPPTDPVDRTPLPSA